MLVMDRIKYMYTPTTAAVPRMVTIPTTKAILDKVRAELAPVRAAFRSPLARAFFDALAFIRAHSPIGKQQHMVAKSALFV